MKSIDSQHNLQFKHPKYVVRTTADGALSALAPGVRIRCYRCVRTICSRCSDRPSAMNSLFHLRFADDLLIVATSIYETGVN